MIRDFLYVDRDRVRALLAQLDGGVLEQVVETSQREGRGQAGSRLLGLIDVRASLTHARAVERTKTVEDALFFIFEDAAEQLGLLRDIKASSDPSVWRSGEIHAELAEAELLRCRAAPTRVVDAGLFRERTNRFVEWAVAVDQMQGDDEAPAAPDEEVGAVVERELGYIRRIGDVYGLMMADQISIRQFPCGIDAPECSLSGTLIARADYLQEEREALFGKYGAAVASWTMVSQVATLPSPSAGAARLPDEPAEDSAGRQRRLFFEELAVFGMKTFEEQGFVEAPAFPSIHVTPVAVYREIPGVE